MIFISAGHGGKDPGAVGFGYKEADLAVQLRDKIISGLRNRNAPYHTDNNDWDLNRTIVETRSNIGDIVCDIHFNAGPPAATGVEVFHPFRPSQEEKDLAVMLSSSMSKIIGIKNRGVKDETVSQHKRLGIFKPNGCNVLLEVCFISNENDLKLYLANIDALADKVAELLVTADNKIV